ncbi:ABC transporter substrate-binding protein [Candidatus Phytoplasma sp. AldY-WA1]|uniref:ABC transporter substrate-binding protein n=1 Tax=Candidatus Phytoplasma sp. AldY-WA1 TaxID=2852100 RepID=UPI00254BB4BF|nr:ABC transporter substrate-binding protein [Candidatus Phytoplasma sp. AldY-WA1]
MIGFNPCDKTHTESADGDTMFNMMHDKLFINYNGELKPQLLKEVPQKEGKILKCELKDNILFHNNEKMTTEDVIFTIEKGKQQKHEQFEQIDKIKKINDLKFEIILKEDVLFWDFPFTWFIRIINKKATEENESKGLKIGAGAYKLTKHIPNKELKFELFEKYHDQDIIKNSPKKIKFKISKDSSALLQELEKKQVNAMLYYPPTEIQNLKDNLKKKYKNIEILEHERDTQSYIYFNKQKTNENVRKIIAKSLDIQTIINDLGLSDKIAKSAFHNKLLGHDPSINYHQPNIELAKTEVQKLSKEDKKLKIGIGKNKTSFHNKIIEQLRNVGFETILDEPEWKTFLQNSKKGKNSPYNFVFLAENFEMKYAHKYIEDYFKSTNESNFFGIDKDDKIDIEDKLTEAKKSLTDSTYESLLKEIEQYLYDKHYLFPLKTEKSIILVNTEIEKGFEQDEFSRFFNMRSIQYKKNNNN